MTDTRPTLTELAVEPTTALAVHFGMLLGVSDIELLAANPRGKLRLHNAWLHGEAVVWGYRVTFEDGARELRVGPGLATDANGRELYLPHEVCLDLDAWYAEQEKAGRRATTDEPLVVDVVIRHRACLSRPVPALAGECDDGPESAYSRVVETVQVALEHERLEGRTAFLRLRDAVGQPTPEAQSDVDDARASLDAVPPEERDERWRAAVARLLAADSLDLAPTDTDSPDARWFPAPEPEAVLVARVTVGLGDDGRATVADDGIDHGVRRVHVPTTVVSDLLLGALTAPPVPPVDAGGPRLDVAAVERPDAKTVRVPVTVPLAPTSLTGVSARRWSTAAGWEDAGATVTYDDTDAHLVVAFVDDLTAGQLVRIHVPGTGATPVVAEVDGRPVPLAGTPADPPAGPDQGRDVVLTIEGS